MRRVLEAALRGLREAAALAAERSRGRRGRIAGTCLGALSGGRHFTFGALAGYVLGALVDAYFERRAAPGDGSREEADAGCGAEPRRGGDAEAEAAERSRLYALFGLEPGAPPDELKRAYRRLCRDVHPDKSGGSEEGFRALKAAYDRLADTPSGAKPGS
jgi:hypothetical protein